MNTKIHISQRTSYTGHKGSIYAMALDSDLRQLYTAGDGGIIALWHLDQDTDQGQGLLRADHAIYTLHLVSSDLLLAGLSDGTLLLIDPKEQRLISKLQLQPTAIYDVYVDREKDLLWVLQGAGYLTVLKLSDRKTIYHHRLSEQHLRRICHWKTAGQVLIGASDGKIYALDENSAVLQHQWQAHENSVFSLATHLAGKYLLSGSRDAQMHVWQLGLGFESLQEIPAHMYTINDIAIAPSGDLIATAGRDKHIKIWDAYSFDLLKVIDAARHQGHTHSVNRLAWLNSHELISVGDDRKVLRWEIESK